MCFGGEYYHPLFIGPFRDVERASTVPLCTSANFSTYSTLLRFCQKLFAGRQPRQLDVCVIHNTIYIYSLQGHVIDVSPSLSLVRFVQLRPSVRPSYESECKRACLRSKYEMSFSEKISCRVWAPCRRHVEMRRINRLAFPHCAPHSTRTPQSFQRCAFH